MRMVNDTANTTENIAEEALEAAILSEAGVSWQELLQLARNDDRSEELRSTALFWLGQEAQDVVTKELEDIATDDIVDLEVRKSAMVGKDRVPIKRTLGHLAGKKLNPRQQEANRKLGHE